MSDLGVFLILVPVLFGLRGAAVLAEAVALERRVYEMNDDLAERDRQDG